MSILKNEKKKIVVILSFIIAVMLCMSACGSKTENEQIPEFEGLKFESKDELKYADQFEIFRYEEGYAYIRIVESDDILIIPENGKVPENLDEDIVVVHKPLTNAYLVATGTMALFDAIDGLDSIAFTGTKADGWYIENAVKEMEAGNIAYAGKYSTPDYEMLVNKGCSLAIENTMIYHSPEVIEKLEELGIPVMVEKSSYEKEPLGRTEWIKVFGAMTGKDEEAGTAFNEQCKIVESLNNIEDTGKTVAYFYVNSNGTVVTRKSEDYISKMIEIAGAHYVYEGLENDNNLSTITMNLEEFYATAKDVDVIIYNSSIRSPLGSVKELLDLSPVFADFKAVKEGNVWCTGKNMFQESDKLGAVIEEMSTIVTSKPEENPELSYFFRLK